MNTARFIAAEAAGTRYLLESRRQRRRGSVDCLKRSYQYLVPPDWLETRKQCEKVKIGIIGVGNMGSATAHILDGKMPELALAAVGTSIPSAGGAEAQLP
jgi:phosphoglycerate dehydrogenase-like enzyme